MKKIFTLFIATVVAISMFALPQETHLLKKLETNHKVSTVDANQDQMFRLAKKDFSKRQPIFELAAQKEKDVPVMQLQQKAPKVLDLVGEDFLVEPEYDDETGEWYIAVGVDGYTFRLCWFGPADSYCGSFTMVDISMEYSWGWFESQGAFYEIAFSDVEMTISEKQVGTCLKQILLEATIIDTNDNTYNLTVVHNMYTPKSIVKTALTNTQITMGEGQFVLDGNNDELDVVLAVNSSVVEGIYTKASLDLTQTKVTYKGVEQTIMKADMMAQSGKLETGQWGYDVNLAFINQDTIQHLVSMPAPLPQPKDTIKISCTNLSLDDSFPGYVMVSGSSDLYDVFAMYVAPTIEAGVYNNVAVTISDMVTWEMTESITAQITINEEKGGALSAHIEAYATDYKCYVVDMKFEIPTPTKTVNVSFNNSSRATFIPQNDNMLQLLNYGDDYEASMTVFGIKPGDTFTMDNVYLDYSGIYDANEQFTIAVADIQGVLNQKGDTTYINASVIGFNAVQYDLELWYTVPTPVDTVEIEMPVDFSNALYDGYYTLSAYTPDSLWYVAISPMTDEVAGTFVNDGMFGRFGTEGGEYDFFSGNTFIFSGKELKNFTVEKGTLVVEMAADSTIFAEAKLIASNAKYYHIKMTSGYNTHLDYDEPFMEVDRTYTSLDNVTIDDQSEQYGYIYLELTAADNSDVAAFFFYVEEADEETIVPVGVYPIDYSEEYGTVAANPGIQGNGVWPSFYAEKADGGLAVPLWLLVGGTVEVSKDEAGNPRLEVNAYNSYGVKVHIVYEVLANGLENIDVENIKGVKKIIKENQLYILRDGKAYNIVGAQIK